MSVSRIAKRVLVTNVEERSMLGTCRSLRAAGYEVGAVAFKRAAAGHWSRSASERLLMTDPGEDAERFVEDLRAASVDGRYSLLLPGSDRALLAISAMRERLDGLARIGLPSHAVVQRSLDREALAHAAAAAGLAPPVSISCASVDDARAAVRELGLPVMVKSIRTVDFVGLGVRQTGASRSVSSEAELADACAEQAGPFLAQRSEPGKPLSFAGVIADGRLLAVALARYRRTWPPPAGNVAFAETIAPPESLEAKVRGLLLEIGWEGIFELELIDRGSGEFVPIDLNPRPYGSIALAVAAGAPLPAIWCDRLSGGSPQPARARPGRRYRWEDADMRHSLWQLRHGNLAAAADAARPHRRVAHAYFQLADPLPLLARSFEIAAGVARTGRRGAIDSPTSADRTPGARPPRRTDGDGPKAA